MGEPDLNPPEYYEDDRSDEEIEADEDAKGEAQIAEYEDERDREPTDAEMDHIQNINDSQIYGDYLE